MTDTDDDLVARLRRRRRPELPAGLRRQVLATGAEPSPALWLWPAAAALLGLLHLLGYDPHPLDDDCAVRPEPPSTHTVITNHPLQRRALLEADR